MNRKTIVVAAAAGALAVSAGTAVALGTNGIEVGSPTSASSTTTSSTGSSTGSSTAAPPASSTSATTSSSTLAPTSAGGGPGATRLSADDAARLVRQRLGGGVVHEVERELEHGRVEWKVEITKDGVTYDIRVDSLSGAVTRVQTDDRDDRGGDDRGGGDDGSGSGNSGSGSDNSGSGSSGRGGGDDHSGDDHGGHGGDDGPGDDHGGDR